MSFPLSSVGHGIAPQLPDLDGLLPCNDPETYELRSGDAAPVPLEGPLTPVECASLLAAANEELIRVENHVLTQRGPLCLSLGPRFERYQLLKHAIVRELFGKSFDSTSLKNTQRGLFQFRQATWALRQLLASESDEHLLEIFKETFEWIRVGRYLTHTLPIEQQVRDYGESFDALLCRLERASTRLHCLEILEEIRSRFGKHAQEALADPSLAQARQRVPGLAASTSPGPRAAIHARPPSHPHLPSRKRPSPDPSTGLGDSNPAGSLAGSPSKRAVITRHDPVPGHGISPQAGPSWSCQ